MNNDLKYKISEFASITGVTPKTLRYYEEKGLLKPYYTDNKNGYRYYDGRKTTEILMIQQLKALGFTLKEIKDFILHKYSLDDKIEALEIKKNKIEEMIALCFYQKQQNFKYVATIKREPSFFCYKKEVTVVDSDKLFDEYFIMLEEIKNKGLTLIFPYYPFIEFKNGIFTEKNITVNLCASVKYKNNNNIVMTNKTEYVTCIHKGDYQSLKNAYDFLQEYLYIKNISINGYPSERYIITAIQTDNPSEYITEVRFPIS